MNFCSECETMEMAFYAAQRGRLNDHLASEKKITRRSSGGCVNHFLFSYQGIQNSKIHALTEAV